MDFCLWRDGVIQIVLRTVEKEELGLNNCSVRTVTGTLQIEGSIKGTESGLGRDLSQRDTTEVPW